VLLHQTVYIVLEYRDPVLNDPVVLVPPCPVEDEHDVAFVDVHEMVELAPYATDEGVAVTVTLGGPTHIDPFQPVPPVQLEVTVF
jgi:hypothetical protein